MADIVDRDTRSRMMSGIRGKNTTPELLIRKALYARGLRYRLHDDRLPGKPDLVFWNFHAIIFIHGCFWHGHECDLFKWPKSNIDFWRRKITRNRELDDIHRQQLMVSGWRVMEVWECATKGRAKMPLECIVNEIESWLRSNHVYQTIEGAQVKSIDQNL
jgi:DNA mismatch endonuclease, patch repair protein